MSISVEVHPGSTCYSMEVPLRDLQHDDCKAALIYVEHGPFKSHLGACRFHCIKSTPLYTREGNKTN